MNRTIAWFAANPVASNLLLIVLTVGGLITLPQITLEVFPEFSSDMITATVEYPGAAPAEVEEAICVRIEEQLQGIEGVKRVTSTASEGVGVVSAELTTDAESYRVLDEIKTRVDAIDTFPDDAEKPIVEEVLLRLQLLNVAVYGDADERSLKQLGEKVRDEIAALPDVNHVELHNARPYEISIEVTENTLRRYGLTIDDIARAVRQRSVDLPGGAIKSSDGEILLRTKGQAYRGAEFESIPLLSRSDGTRLTIGDVADVVDGFADTDQSARFDGKPAVLVQVFRTGDQSALDLSAMIADYVERARPSMPEGVELTIWLDDSVMLGQRLNTLLSNGRDGFFLVLVVLALFLRTRVALWVLLGIPISFLGTLSLMPILGVSINIISLFAFIVVLGILVDDAIVVGENVYTMQAETGQRLQAAIVGTQRVSIPVLFGVLTSMAAFSPLLFVPGPMGRFIRVIPLCVITALFFSLVESQLILPSHLAQGGDGEAKRWFPRLWRALQALVDRGLRWFLSSVYEPLLEAALRWRYLTLAIGIAGLLITGGLVAGGWVKFYFNHAIEADNVLAYVTMPEGTPAEATAKAVEKLERSARELSRELARERGAPIATHIMVSVGDQPYRTRQTGGSQFLTFAAPNVGEVNLELLPSEQRGISAGEVARRWRERSGAIPDAVELLFSSELINTGEAINVQLGSPRPSDLRAASADLRAALSEYAGVVDITDSFRGGKREWTLNVRPAAEAIGIAVEDLGTQVRQAFYGEEAQRIQRGRDEVRVMVRYPLAHRRSLTDIESMYIRAPDGRQLPFRQVAIVDTGRGFANIKRANRQRVVNVTADVDERSADTNEIVASLSATILPELQSRYPGLTYSFEGEQREQAEILDSLGSGFIVAMFLIYSLLAVPLRSYTQPFLIMTAIPFGFIGAVWGHVILGWDMSMFSIVGMIALAGVVVNDSLVLVDYTNQRRAQGTPLRAAVSIAGRARFRAILLTSLTTFAGLTPLMLEQSIDARFLLPMAISLSFGVLFSSSVSLLMVPATYLILEDLHGLARRATGRFDNQA
jgi:multidrug efflux pump subunit AcrB